MEMQRLIKWNAMNGGMEQIELQVMQSHVTFTNSWLKMYANYLSANQENMTQLTNV